MNVHHVNINGVEIVFPFTPYRTQEEFMRKVLECLLKGVNGVLESPSGTGKTLSLLCSSLAWVRHRKATAPDRDAPMILYASRTHAQLQQVVEELRRSEYAEVEAAVFSSQELSFQPDLGSYRQQIKEALCSAGDILFVPHYFLFHPYLRKLQGLSLHNCAVVLDDGHHVATSCEEAYSARISSQDLAHCVAHVTQKISWLEQHADESHADEPHSDQSHADEPHADESHVDEPHSDQSHADKPHADESHADEPHSDQSHADEPHADESRADESHADESRADESPADESYEVLTLQDFTELKSVFLAMAKAIDEVKLKTIISGPDRGKKEAKGFPGTYIFQFFENAGITVDKMDDFVASLFGWAEGIASRRDEASSEGGRAIIRLSGFLGTIIGGADEHSDLSQIDLNFKVYIEPEVRDQSQTTGKVINFWCLNPSLALKSLKQQGVTSIILTSGTLSPLSSIVDELGIPVSVFLQNPHIIEQSQVSVISLSKGPGKHSLISTFSNRENPLYLNDLGRVLRDLCPVVPGGMLVVFPSYSLLREATRCWELSGVRQEIDQRKRLFEEPHSREDLAPVMEEYCRTLEAAGSRGAVLLAVMRGKVAEEVDLAGSQCRAVVVVGVPYLPSQHPRINFKRQFIRTNRPRPDPQGTNAQRLTDSAWFEAQASRAVNQAVGRLIRRADDYGVVLLCDTRFQNPNVVDGLSAWLKPCVSHCENSEAACREVSMFFEMNEKAAEEKRKAMRRKPVIDRIFIGPQ